MSIRDLLTFASNPKLRDVGAMIDALREGNPMPRELANRLSDALELLALCEFAVDQRIEAKSEFYPEEGTLAVQAIHGENARKNAKAAALRAFAQELFPGIPGPPPETNAIHESKMHWVCKVHNLIENGKTEREAIRNIQREMELEGRNNSGQIGKWWKDHKQEADKLARLWREVIIPRLQTPI